MMLEGQASLYLGDSLQFYRDWPKPTVIISDGAYGLLGFEGDTSDHLSIPPWYEPHVRLWSELALPQTTLWFWNTEIGWASAHPLLERYGWRYQNLNVWNKGLQHIAGNVDTKKIRRFPVVTEICCQYVFEPKVACSTLKQWLLREWRRTGLTLKSANEACGVKDAATRKYLNQGRLWYFPPVQAMQLMVNHANQHGRPEGRPYFSLDGQHPVTPSEWKLMRAKFNCPHGVTNCWNRGPVNGHERVKVGTKMLHPNQKPLDLMSRLIEASSDPGDVVWEPFGGLFSGSLAAKRLGRRAFGAELQPIYYEAGIARF